MRSITYTAARNQLANVIALVNEDHAPLLITRQKGAPAVLMSLEDFHSWEETAYLLRSPENARRLKSAIAQLEAGKGHRLSLLSSGPTKHEPITSGSRSTSRRSHQRINRLIEEIQATPFAGIGKPEPLKHELAGYWSRRVSEEQCANVMEPIRWTKSNS